MGRLRQADCSRLSQHLHACGYVHSVAEQVSVANHGLSNMQPDTESDLALLRNILVNSGYPLLDAERTLERVNGVWELCENAVSGRVGNTPAVVSDKPVGHLTM